MASRHADTRTVSREIVGPDGDGFFPLTHTLGQGQAGVAKTGGSTPDLQAFERGVADLRGHEPRPCAQSLALSFLRDQLARHAADLERDGIRPLFFIGPGTTRETVFLGLRADGTLPDVVRLQRPRGAPRSLRARRARRPQPPQRRRGRAAQPPTRAGHRVGGAATRDNFFGGLAAVLWHRLRPGETARGVSRIFVKPCRF